MLRRAYNWTMKMAAHPRAEWVLGAVSFAESSLFPIPPDAMLVPMMLAKPERAWRIALICTITSVVGGLLGYSIGYFLFETIGHKIIAFYHLEREFAGYTDWFNRYGLWVILIKGLTPIPYKLVTIASGVAKFDLLVFVLASIATRGLRFFLLGALLWWKGPPIREFIEKYLTWVTTAFVVLLVGGFIALKYI